MRAPSPPHLVPPPTPVRAGEDRTGVLVQGLKGYSASEIIDSHISRFYTPEDCALGRPQRLLDCAVRDGCALTLRLEGPVVGKWDELRLEQVLANLLSNAVRYAAGAPIEIAVRAEGDTALLTVSDGGPGIPQSEWERVFSRFERAASRVHFGGLGLGLYVAQQIVDGHGGSIAIEPIQPREARFVVRLPRGNTLS